MSTDNFIEKLAAQFGQSASVKNVYGERAHDLFRPQAAGSWWQVW